MKTPVSTAVITGLALSLVLGGCTLKSTVQQTTDTTSNVTGTTSSAHSWVTEDGLLKPEHKAIAFVTLNRDHLQQDAAMGQGEYLNALSTLLEVPPQQQLAYGTAIQSRYTSDLAGSEPDPTAWLTVLNDTARAFRQDRSVLSRN